MDGLALIGELCMHTVGVVGPDGCMCECNGWIVYIYKCKGWTAYRMVTLLWYIQHLSPSCTLFVLYDLTSLSFYIGYSVLCSLDMKALKLLVGLGHMTDDSMVIGRCTLPDLSGLTEKHPYEK